MGAHGNGCARVYELFQVAVCSGHNAYVGTAHRGHGYAAEAAQALIAWLFNTLSVQRVVATTEYANTASQRVMQRLGMRIEHNPAPTPEWFQVVGILENKPPE